VPGFENIKITNGYGQPLSGSASGNPVSAPPDQTAPVLTKGTVTRTSDTQATVQFHTNESGKYYYTTVTDGTATPSISTSGTGTSLSAGWLTVNLTVTTGAKDFYVRVKDAAGNVSNALKLDIPAYVPPTPPPEEPAPPQEPEEPEEPVSPPPTQEPATQGGIIYLNPAFPNVKIKFGW
jgi:hypothetical protein